jgi:DNA-binding transcriptional MerR regulator
MGIQPIRKHVLPEIPDKLYFRIGDVARLCEVPAYVLRFWETEFPQLRPNKGGTGQRLYRKRDVEMALRIKSLLYDQGYTIPGARQVFKEEAKARETAASEAAVPVPASAPEPAAPASPALAGVEKVTAVRSKVQLRAIRDELRSLLNALEQPIGLSGEQVVRPAAKLHTFGPRLVLEPRSAPSPSSEPLRLIDTRPQGDLFPGE